MNVFTGNMFIDKRLLGFFDDYTASNWKNTAGLDLEFEIVPQFFYSGPFVNTGYFRNESLEWTSRTGGGIMGVFEFKNSYIGIYFAWDLSKGPSTRRSFHTCRRKFLEALAKLSF